MKSKTWIVVAVFVVWMISSVSVVQCESDERKGFDRIDGFTLHDHLGAQHSLKDWDDKKFVVVVFLGTECPLAKLYAPKLVQLAEQYAARGVQFVGINSNQQDTLHEIAHYVRVHKIEFPVLKDPVNDVANQFHATRTPSCFVLDERRSIRYRGRIDDQYGPGYSRANPTRNDLAEALDELLSAKPVSVPNAPEAGCHIGRIQRKVPTGDITYSKQVARLMQQHCERCHRPGQIAPFSLMTFADATAWSESIRESVVERRMPPWHANPHYGHFSNDAGMSDSDKQLLVQWIDNGMPEGDRRDLPAAKDYPDGWQLTRRDVTYKMSQPFDVPATGVIPYQYFTVDAHFDEDVWIQGAEIRPGNPSVVHHVFAFYLPPGQETPRAEDPLFNAIAGFAPGMPAGIWPEGHARLIPQGSKLMFQVHYTPNGSKQSDQTEIGIVFADSKSAKKEIRYGIAANLDFRIPPQAERFHVVAGYQFTQDTLLHAMVPHMHFRGKAFRFTAKYPDGTDEILLDVPHYQFNWQNAYLLKDVKTMPSGTVLMCDGYFDNSAKNLDNPDPTREVIWGDQTFDEMMLGTFVISLPDSIKRGDYPKVTPAADQSFDVVFRFHSNDIKAVAEAVYLAGSFNDWNATQHKMTGPDAMGWYQTSMSLRAGNYEYKFVLDGKQWTHDPGNPDRNGPFTNSVLRIRSSNEKDVVERAEKRSK